MSLDFNGTTSKLVRSGAIFANSFPIAIFGFVKLTGIAGAYQFHINYASAGNAALTAGQHGGLESHFAQLIDSANVSALIARPTPANAWIPFMLRRDSNTSGKMYLGVGTAVDTTTQTLDPSVLNNLCIGAAAASGATWTGSIAEYTFWQGTVPDDDGFAAIAAGAAPNTIASSGCIACWPMLTQAATQVDIVNGYVLTATNTSQGATHPITRSAGGAKGWSRWFNRRNNINL